MTATVQVQEAIGAGTDDLLVAADGFVHLLSLDVHSNQAADGYTEGLLSSSAPYSYERWIRVKFSGTSYISVRNFRFWADNLVVPAGWAVKWGTTPTYSPPTNSASSVATTAVPTSTPSGHNVGPSSPLTGPGTNFTDWIVLQAHVTDFSAIDPGPLLGSTGSEVTVPTQIGYHFGWIES